MKRQIDSKSSRKNSRETIAQMMRNFFDEFCSNTTVHGVRYFTERRRHWTERCWWIIAICLAVWFCGSSIQDVWLKWRDNPVTMNMNEKLLPIPTVPFPTITICPEVKTHKNKLDLNALYGLLRWEWNISMIEFERAKGLAHICNLLYVQLVGWREYSVNASIYRVIEEMAPSLHNSIFNCFWTYGGSNCTELFTPIITEEGLCFAFNALNSNDIYTKLMTAEMMGVVDRPNVTHWDPENGYDDIANQESYPMHVYSAREGGVIEFNVRANDEDIEYICRSLTPGVKIFIHTPGNVLRSTDAFIRVGFFESVEISFKPKLTTTSNGLRKYSPEQRQCFFNSERHLSFFKIYSQENCEAECLANYTLLECGCVKFSMPRNESTKICGSYKINCYKLAYWMLFEEDIIGGMMNKDEQTFRQNCNCLPACATIVYETDIDRTKLDWKAALRRRSNVTDEDLSKNHVSLVRIFFQHYQISSLKREEQYTNTDFFAICGGLLGLCLGVSALSIVEFFYYSTLRLFWSLRKRKLENVIIPFKPERINHISIDMPYV